ncbi:hypothetical protein GCM10027184_53150 [Saccharothrix stipae]
MRVPYLVVASLMTADRRSVEAMLDRCSDRTVVNRCGGGSPDAARLSLPGALADWGLDPIGNKARSRGG